MKVIDDFPDIGQIGSLDMKRHTVPWPIPKCAVDEYGPLILNDRVSQTKISGLLHGTYTDDL
jgi:hypothetical protein